MMQTALWPVGTGRTFTVSTTCSKNSNSNFYFIVPVLVLDADNWAKFGKKKKNEQKI
jgi:hypothetical protein